MNTVPDDNPVNDLQDARTQLVDAIRQAAKAGLTPEQIADHLNASIDEVQRVSGDA